MSNIDLFERFAADFEEAVEDDDWLRLEKYFAGDATYLNLGGPEPKCVGRDTILGFFKEDVTNTDRKYDTRKLTALSPPLTDGECLSRKWRCEYTLKGTPDLTLEGESRYLFENDLIKTLEVELTENSIQTLKEWMHENGDKLQK